jgi:hypothetical protein
MLGYFEILAQGTLPWYDKEEDYLLDMKYLVFFQSFVCT